MPSVTLKADLHVHSKYSKRPSQWILQKLDCPESFTDPLKVYRIARSRGMDLITITDHNSIAGSMEIAHLKGAFVSEEITAYFPEDGCKIHVLALNINEKQHKDIQHLREDVYSLVPYLRQEKIIHILAHPFFDMNHCLNLEHFEKSLLLFELFELNGARDNFQNQTIKQVLNSLRKEDIDYLANKHDLQPVGKTPWIKGISGGSDDHSSLNIARVYTEIAEADGLQDYLYRLQKGQGEVQGHSSTAKTLAHNLYSIAYQFYKSKFNFESYVQKDELLRFVDCALTGNAAEARGLVSRLQGYIGSKRSSLSFFKNQSLGLTKLILKEGQTILQQNPNLQNLMHKSDDSFWDREDYWFSFVQAASDKLIQDFSENILDKLTQVRFFNMFESIGSGASVYTLLAPYFVAFRVFSKDRWLVNQCRQRFLTEVKNETIQESKVALFTDTYDHVNGVALTLQLQAELAGKYRKSLQILTCGSTIQTENHIDFHPTGKTELPEYPGLNLAYPSFLEVLKYCAGNDFTHIHTSTPGPMGLVALGIARILQLPIYGTYHTAFPQYAKELTGDAGVEAFMWKLMIIYYNKLDMVYVPSRATAEELVEKGLNRKKIVVYPRGIDIQRFHPGKRNGFWQKFNNQNNSDIKLLYVGRVSKEKNLDVLVDAYQKIAALTPKTRLMVVGDGPYLEAMRSRLAGTNCIFTGSLYGEDLAQAFASSDVFVFPSSTDTFGNVVLEAQSSGLPVIVSDQGGPQENLIADETGFIVRARDVKALVQAILHLVVNPNKLQEMKIKSRKYMESRSMDKAFLEHWEIYERGSKQQYAKHGQNLIFDPAQLINSKDWKVNKHSKVQEQIT